MYCSFKSDPPFSKEQITNWASGYSSVIPRRSDVQHHGHMAILESITPPTRRLFGTHQTPVPYYSSCFSYFPKPVYKFKEPASFGSQWFKFVLFSQVSLGWGPLSQSGVIFDENLVAYFPTFWTLLVLILSLLMLVAKCKYVIMLKPVGKSIFPMWSEHTSLPRRILAAFEQSPRSYQTWKDQIIGSDFGVLDMTTPIFVTFESTISH